MTRDEEMFPDPDTFNPDRYTSKIMSENENVHALNTYKPDEPGSFVFGFGRR